MEEGIESYSYFLLAQMDMLEMELVQENNYYLLKEVLKELGMQMLRSLSSSSWDQ